MTQNIPLVSISSTTYNHANYIRQCIKGFLMQKTTFSFEILIHDDASTDGTAEIIKEYERKYPHLIRPIFQQENQYSKGVMISPTYNWPRAHGKYIALCEGDDYWTDPYKLQKQVDFLEREPDFTLCAHAVEVVFEDDWRGPKDRRLKEPIEVSDFMGVTSRHFIPTNSMVFRSEYVKNLPAWFSKMLSGDIPLAWILTSHGKCYYMPDIMGVKRINGGGITADSSRHGRIREFYADLYYFINLYSRRKYQRYLLPKILKSSKGMILRNVKDLRFGRAIKYALRIINTIYW